MELSNSYQYSDLPCHKHTSYDKTTSVTSMNVTTMNRQMGCHMLCTFGCCQTVTWTMTSQTTYMICSSMATTSTVISMKYIMG